MKEVILVDMNDVAIGSMEKMEVHRKGMLHRAFSVFILNAKGEMLLQRRAIEKYHSGGLWTNACCSHPAPGESLAAAAQNRLQEEMGFTTELAPMFSFTYRAEFENGLIEHELDHVFFGEYNGPVVPDSKEVMSYKFAGLAEIKEEMEADPGRFTAWFNIALPKVEKWLKVNKQKMPEL